MKENFDFDHWVDNVEQQSLLSNEYEKSNDKQKIEF
jgi:hypothetical protein